MEIPEDPRDDFFDELVRRAGFEDARAFVGAVRRRLKKGEAEYADNPSDSRPLEEIIGEMAEEAQDIGGWGSRAHRSPSLDDLHPADAKHVETILLDMALDGFRLHHKADMLIDFIAEAQRRKPEPVPAPPPTIYYED